MKKKNIILGLLSAFAMVSLASCNNASVLPGGDDNNNDTPVDDGNNNNGNNNNDNKNDDTKDEGFVINVKMPDGSAATGVWVQWCDDKGCYDKLKVDENGKATYAKPKEDGKYEVHISDYPAGYTSNPFELIQTKENKNATIYLKKLNTFAEGTDGSKENPYNLAVGYSKVEIAEGNIAYLTFSSTVAGTYTIESITASTETLNKNVIANIYDSDNKMTTASKSTNKYNFTYDLEYTEDDVKNNVSYRIAIMIDDKDAEKGRGEAPVSLMVTKK